MRNVETITRTSFSLKPFILYITTKTVRFTYIRSFIFFTVFYVFYRRIFNLEKQNFSLENHRLINARQPFR